MGLPFILRNFSIHVDGTPKYGEGEECTIPALELQVEEFRGGGMDIPIELDLGMKKLEARFKLFSTDPQAFTTFGLAPGNLIPLTFRGHLVSEGSGAPRRVIVNMRALPTKVDAGNWQAGRKTEINVSANLHYLKITHGDTVIVEIDPENSKRIINGVDQLSEMRINLGF